LEKKKSSELNEAIKET